MTDAMSAPLTLAQRDHAIEQVMERYHHVGLNHVPADDPIGECPECADIVGMFLTVERYAVERDRAEAAASPVPGVLRERIEMALADVPLHEHPMRREVWLGMTFAEAVAAVDAALAATDPAPPEPGDGR